MKRMAGLILTTFFLGFTLFWLAGVLLKNSLIFHPPAPGYELAPPYQTTRMEDETRIVYRVWENPRADRVMIYSHGNAEDLGNLGWAMPFYRDLGYTVVAYDYPGYGHSGGRPTTENTTEALIAVIHRISEDRNLSPEQITLFGKSIGGGPSVAAAARIPVGGLMLESTFTSIFQVPLPSLRLPLDSFLNEQLIQQIDCPVLIIHGIRDTVIAHSHGERLYQAAQEPKALLSLEDAGHNDVLFTTSDLYQPFIRDFPRSLHPEWQQKLRRTGD